MLELKNITKIYPASGQKVEALRGVSVQFRRNEFVSILGPSGCGKTTLLNIVGGLDQYTSGDLVIHGKSTKEFTDRDWDAYRNHSIGFVFQSYNLIPHQSVLQNVELALTLSGVSKHERRTRAKEALERVGLGDQIRKKPSQLSGGQMQRVAIARAIVNNPDIILADEPTGALDTQTGTQVMDILKDIARDRLVIMVTHNATLAQQYATRIIRMLDGHIVDDSKPLSAEDIRKEVQLDQQYAYPAGKVKMPSMSLRTSFGLSLKNLFTKKSRTLLTSFAGSIGIIGIALIYAVSNGMTAYIDTVQEDTLSSYPLTLEAQHMDMGSLMQSFLDKAQSVTQHEQDGVYQKSMIYEMINALNANEQKENDLKTFKQHLEAVRADEDSENPLKTVVSGVQYTYNTDLLVYTKNVDGNILQSDPQILMRDILSEYMQADLSAMMEFRDNIMKSNRAAVDNMIALWREMLPGEDGQLISPLFEKQYDLLYGAWPTQYNEIMLIVDEDGELSDLTLYALGLVPRENIDALMRAALAQEPFTYQARGWRYEEICALDFRVILNADCYVQDAATGLYTDLRTTDAGLQYLYDNGLKLKVSGILKPSDNSVATILTGGIAYTSLLTEFLVDKGNTSPMVQQQLATPDTDILTGLPFPDSGTITDEAKAQALRDYLAGLDEAGKAQAYIAIQSIPSDEIIAQSVQQQLATVTRPDMEIMMVQALSAQMSMDEATIAEYLAARSDDELTDMFVQLLTKQAQAQYKQHVAARLSGMSTQQLAMALDVDAAKYTDAQCIAYYEHVLTFSDSTLEKNLEELGYVDLSSPATINLYAATFADKDRMERAIADYNESVNDLEEITYTDYVGLMMRSVTTIINAITWVLIAFVAISLIVSSIMIGVITLISVQERTREIGILRAIGASKRNVSSMFTAETVLIGLAAGALGVCITWLLCIPINALLHQLTGIANLSAFLDLRVALILVAISMLLTLIAGVIPSRSAAKKDPVLALRTE
ncbi:MAG: ATP-binding cassette domain-containing protein [Christensenellales bacterium]|jgi:putative ABC transport system permease protein